MSLINIVNKLLDVIQKEIGSCNQLLSEPDIIDINPLESEIRKIGETLSVAKPLAAGQETLLSRIHLLQDTLADLDKRVQNAIGKQAKAPVKEGKPEEKALPSTSSFPRRSYLRFPKAQPPIMKATATTSSECRSTMQQLWEALVKLKLQEYFELVDEQDDAASDGSSPALCFRYTAIELSALIRAHEELQAFFWGKNGSPSKLHVFASSDEQDQALIADADRFYAELPSDLKPLRMTIYPGEWETESDRILLENLYQKRKLKGICIGESHYDAFPKRFIIENLPELRKMGVTTIFIEHIAYDVWQSHLDAYFASSSATMHPLLEKSLERIGHLELVRKAKEAGMRIVCMDTSTTVAFCGASTGVVRMSNSKDENGGNLYLWERILEDETVDEGTQVMIDRLKTMNCAAARIIGHEAGAGNFIVLTGAAHCVHSHGVPGLGTLLQCPVIFCETSEKDGVTHTKSFDEKNNNPLLPQFYLAKPLRKASSGLKRAAEPRSLSL